MDKESFRKLESVINSAASAGAASADERYLNELRSAPNRWSIGLELFLSADSTVAKFFGLSLVRDYLAGSRNDVPAENRLQIRQVMLNWLVNTCSAEVSQQTNVPAYIQNNIATVLVRSLKLDFPTEWPNAFGDIMSLSKMGLLGFAVSVRVLIDLDVEVISFDDRRTSEEVVRNSLIKDTMREQNILKDIVEFLCQSTRQLMRSQSATDVKLARKCLHALSTLIGWIDVGLIANNETLGLLYECLRVPALAAGACTCLFELVKKGMEPATKVMLVYSIELLPLLQQIPIPGDADGSDEDEDEDEDGESCYVEVLATTIDLLFQEVMSCWYLFEEHVLRVVPPTPAKNGSPSGSRKFSGAGACGTSGASTAAVDTQALTTAGPIAGTMLHQCVPLLLTLLLNPQDTVYSAVIPSLSKLLALHKQQSAYEIALKECTRSVPSCFVASGYIAGKPDLLMGVYRALQHDVDFRFDLEDEEDCEVIEMKKQVRKLFVNYCRAAPDMCLQLVTTVLMQQPQPLSKAPFPPLEAACRLVHAFGEGVSPALHRQFVGEGAFPQLLQALHETDVTLHSHPQVLLAYFELCSRYVKQSTEASLCRMVGSLLTHGLRHPTHVQVRCRCAYLFLKMVEGLETKAATLVPVVGSLGDLILNDGVSDQAPLLTQTAELHLLEAIGIITSSSQQMLPNTYAYLPQSGVAVDATTTDLQQRMLTDLVSLLVKQLQGILVHPEVMRYQAEFAAVVTHKISSISSLSKGYSRKHHAASIPVFMGACEHGVIRCIDTFGRFSSVRGRLVVFIHRMVQSIGRDVLLVLVVHCVKCIFTHAESSREVEMAVQMLNQLMIEFGADAVPLMEKMFPVVMAKFGSLFAELDSAVASCIAANDVTGGGPAVTVPAHLESERTSLLKLYMQFLQHLALYECSAALFLNNVNTQYLDCVFGIMLQILQSDGRVDIQIRSGGTVGTGLAAGCWRPLSPVVMLALKKNIVHIVTGLSKSWLGGVGSCNGNSTGVVPPDNVVGTYKVTLFSQFLPLLLSACYRRNPTVPATSVSHSVIPASDAQGLSLIADIGGLLWTVVNVSGAHTPEFLSYMQTSLLPGLGWTAYPAVCSEFNDQLRSCVPTPRAQGEVVAPAVGVYKETFKKSIKALHTSV